MRRIIPFYACNERNGLAEEPANAVAHHASGQLTSEAAKVAEQARIPAGPSALRVTVGIGKANHIGEVKHESEKHDRKEAAVSLDTKGRSRDVELEERDNQKCGPPERIRVQSDPEHPAGCQKVQHEGCRRTWHRSG